MVIGRHVVALTALFVQPDPSAPSLDEVLLDFHADRRANAGEGEHHEADESAIAQAHHARHLFFLAALDLYRSHQGNTIEQRARLTKIPALKSITCTNHCPQTAKPRLRSVPLSSSACYDSYRGTHPEPRRSSLNQFARCIQIPNPAGSLNAHMRTYNMPN